MTTHNTHNRQTSMATVGFESKISAGEGPQTYAIDRAATGTGTRLYGLVKYAQLIKENKSQLICGCNMNSVYCEVGTGLLNIM